MITSMACIIIASASLFNWILAIEQVPVRLGDFLLNLGLSRTSMILSIILLLYIVGMFMDVIASMIILVPILSPIGHQLGFDPIHWGILIVLLFCMGGITPPLGINLFIATGIAKCKFEETAKSIIPFVLILLISVLLVAFIPQLTTLIPSLMGD